MNKLLAFLLLGAAGAAHAAGGWCYKPGECEAWLFQNTLTEMKDAICYVGWPADIDLPEREPAAFWSETPVDGFDFIPGDAKVPPHRAPHPTRAVPATLKDDLYDLGHLDIGYVELHAKSRPKLFAGESPAEARCDDFRWFEQNTDMISAGADVWRSRYPLALRYFRIFCMSTTWDVRFLSQVPPRELARRFTAPDARAQKIWDIGVNTLNLCTRTFLLDGIKRDRMPWAGDVVVAILSQAYAYRDPEPVKRTLVALGTPPEKGNINGIGSYTLWWVIAHDVFQREFDEPRFLALHYPRIRARVDDFNTHLDTRGYFAKDLGWNFIDWTDSKGGVLQSETTLQVIYFAALKAAARLATRVKDTTSAAKWDAQAETLRTKLMATGMDGTRHARALAIVFDLVDGARAKQYAAEIAAGNLPPTVTPYMAAMEVWALMKSGETAAARRRFDAVWGAMADLGVDAYWEGFDPRQTGDDHYEYYGRKFGKSLCHIWSTGPVFLLPMYPALALPERRSPPPDQPPRRPNARQHAKPN